VIPATGGGCCATATRLPGEHYVSSTSRFATASPIPSLASRYVGSWMYTLVTLAIVSSFTALNLVTVSALSRMTYSMARDKLLPGWLGELNRFRAPGRAALVLGVASLVYVIAVGSHWGPTNLAAWTSYFATLFWILAYACVVIGIVRFIWTKYRSEWSWWRHGLIPLIAFGGVVWVARGNVNPFPPSPLSWFIWATIAITLAVVVFAYWLKRRRPDIVERAAYVFDDQEHDGSSMHQSASGVQEDLGAVDEDAGPVIGPA